MPILEARDVHYAYETHRVLRGVSLALERGKLYAILGPSGCGKTTLLSLLGGLDSPTQGQILFDGEDIAQHGLARHRRDHVSFVFQAYNLIDYLTPVENVALSGTPHPLPLVEQLGLTPEEARRRIATLSGGQQQRVAIAGLWPPRRRSSSRMSPLAIWTQTPPGRSPGFSRTVPIGKTDAWWWSPTTMLSPREQTSYCG